MDVGIPACHLEPLVAEITLDEMVRHAEMNHSCSYCVAELMQAGMGVTRTSDRLELFDEQSLSSVATIEDGGLKNLSGQVYKAIIFPSMTVITRSGLERLRACVKAGGEAIFDGQTLRLVVDKTFLDAKGNLRLWLRRRAQRRRG
jgi:hypothetical protein